MILSCLLNYLHLRPYYPEAPRSILTWKECTAKSRSANQKMLSRIGTQPKIIRDRDATHARMRFLATFLQGSRSVCLCGENRILLLFCEGKSGELFLTMK
jgi:hypothetical protein